MADSKNILLWAAVGFAIYLAMQGNTGSTGGGTTTIVNSGSGSAIDQLKGFIDQTVTFDSYDVLSQSTSAGTAHRILKMGSNGALKNTVVNDGGTKTATAGQAYLVLLGNSTTALGQGPSDYYPTLVEGTLPNEKTATIDAGQAKIKNVTFAFLDEYGRPNTAQAVGAGEPKTIEIKLTANSGGCYGNPSATKKGDKNVICFEYNTTVWNRPVLVGADTAPQPQSMSVEAGDSISCYKFPVICDNDPAQPEGSQYDYRAYLKIESKSGQNPVTDDNTINVSMSDVSIDYNTKTLEPLYGIEDEDQNDIGARDLGTGTNAKDGGYGILVS